MLTLLDVLHRIPRQLPRPRVYCTGSPICTLFRRSLSYLPASIETADRLATGASREGRQKGVCVIIKKSHRAVSEKEVRTARVQAPKMHLIARIVHGARLKVDLGLRTKGADIPVRGS